LVEMKRDEQIGKYTLVESMDHINLMNLQIEE
jgi:hypothetical protein